jgi:hypothetical protein
LHEELDMKKLCARWVNSFFSLLGWELFRPP